MPPLNVNAQSGQGQGFVMVQLNFVPDQRTDDPGVKPAFLKRISRKSGRHRVFYILILL